MKTRFLALLVAGLFLPVLISSCLKDTCDTTRKFIRFDPVYKTTEECRKGIALEAARPMKKPGKIYYFDHYLLINEVKEGIHIFDNADASNPVPLAFWNIEGNVDMAIRGNYLYADQYMDMLTIDISNLQSPTLACRAENVFNLHGFDPYLGFIVDYTPTEVTEEVKCYDDRFNQNFWWDDRAIFMDASFAGGESLSNGAQFTGANIPAATGISGSYARFCFYDNYLYTVDNANLRPFDLTNPSCPTGLAQIPVGWNIETIFPFQNRLFLGSQTGVFIYNATNPLAPVYESGFSHAFGCDPVICDDKYAYVTIHDGTICNGTVNQLDVIGIEHLPATSLLQTYQMKRPMGLGMTDELLFVCDDGLKIYDKADPLHLQLIKHKNDIKAYDAIALGDDRLLIIGEDGFYQYDTSDPANLVELSKLLVQK